MRLSVCAFANRTSDAGFKHVESTLKCMLSSLDWKLKCVLSSRLSPVLDFGPAGSLGQRAPSARGLKGSSGTGKMDQEALTAN